MVEGRDESNTREYLIVMAVGFHLESQWDWGSAFVAPISRDRNRVN